jgi:hypothetical protein
MIIDYFLVFKVILHNNVMVGMGEIGWVNYDLFGLRFMVTWICVSQYYHWLCMCLHSLSYDILQVRVLRCYIGHALSCLDSLFYIL